MLRWKRIIKFVRRRLYKSGKRFSKRSGYVGLALLIAFSGVGIDIIFFKPHKVGATTFTTSGTWTVPTGQNSAVFEAWGGGASGNGSSTTGTGGGGGPGGQYAKTTINVTPGDIYTVTVSPTASGSSGFGSPGGDSSVTNPSSVVIVRAKGGPAFLSGSDTDYATTASGIGDIVYRGGKGGPGSSTSAVTGGGGGGGGSTGAGGDTSGTAGGTGTASNGGNGGAAGSNANGSPGLNYGGGGGGASKTGGGNKIGGDGAQGLVVITPSTSVESKKIRQEINILDGTLAVSSTSGSIVQLDTTKYYGTVSYYFEVVTAAASASTDSVTLTRSGTATNDSTISLAGTGAGVRVRSAAFTPPSGQTSYSVITGANHSIKAARIIVIQDGLIKVDSSESQIEIGDQETGKTNTAAAALTNPKYWHYTAANWDAQRLFYAEVTKAQSGTNFTTTFMLQQDDGAFGTWTDVATIVNADPNIAASRFRVSFTPIDGRNYRISAAESASNAGKNYSIYNAKIIVDQLKPTWSAIGSSLNIGAAAISAFTSSTIAYVNATSQTLGTYSFNGSSWSLVGTALSVPMTASHVGITTLSSTQIAYIDDGNQQLRTYSWNGSTWSQVGSSFSLPNVYSIATLSSTRVAGYDNVGGDVKAYDWNGSTWSQTGSAFFDNAAVIVGLDSSTIALLDTTFAEFESLTFDGTNWTRSSAIATVGVAGDNVSIAALSSAKVVIYTQSDTTLGVYDYDGSCWTKEPITDYHPTTSAFPLTALSSTRIAQFASSAALQAYDLDTTDSMTINNLESQYLLLNTSNTGTGLQTTPTLWDSSEWAGVFNAYKHAFDSNNASNSAKLQDIDNANTDVPNSTVTGINQVMSSGLSLPASGHQIDTDVVTSTGAIAASKIIVLVSIYTTNNSSPSAPTLITPSSGTTGVSVTPSFTLRTTDADSDYLQYRIYLYQSDCSTALSGSPFDMSGLGWSGMDANSNTAYAGSSALTSSTIATYAYSGTLVIGATYCWKADAIDPGGSNVYGSASATQLFSTVSGAVKINGGVNIRGGSTVQ
jgi:hypothetical protein